ncbi:uncharacterized protein LOC122310921 [Carya illinoinensis]|uniref:uncharacterized protein LOC122310921 n=1 Tax=Carya illinoinensis TaxID=32201 RepID=UPI001C7214C0|nr:uncharacterized protein LOC122310921 [Carya illinoinensis]
MSRTASLSQAWKKPPDGTYKMNWDASLDTTRGLVGIGAIIRDSYGRVLGTFRARREITLSPYAAEVYALMMAILFCKEAGINEVTLEGDSLQVVKKLKDSREDWSPGGLIVEDTRAVLRSFAFWNVCHTKRDGNVATHLLAKDALLSEFDLYDLEEIPNCIKQVVASDAL